MHIHHIIRIGNFNFGRKHINAVAAQHFQNGFSAAHQRDLRAKVPDCLHRTHYGRHRGIVSAHCV